MCEAWAGCDRNTYICLSAGQGECVRKQIVRPSRTDPVLEAAARGMSAGTPQAVVAGAASQIVAESGAVVHALRLASVLFVRIASSMLQ